MQNLVTVGTHILNYPLRTQKTPSNLKEVKNLEAKQEKQKNCITTLLNKVAEKIFNLDESEHITIRKVQVGDKTFYKVLSENEQHKFKGVNITDGTEKALIDAILNESGDPSELVLTHDKVSEQMKTLVDQFVDIENKDTLYLWSSGGGGHKSAKEAQVEKSMIMLQTQILQRAPAQEANAFQQRFQRIEVLTDWCKQVGIFHESDVLTDYLGDIGIESVESWDNAQKEGNVQKQELLASMQWVSDSVFATPIYAQTLDDLIRNKPKQIISTQAMATPAILHAVKKYNESYKPPTDPPVILHLYMTDMPTQLAEHFFSSLKHMWGASAKEYLVLHAPKPKDGDTWQARADLVDWQVVELDTKEFPVRAAFFQAVQDFNPNNPITFKVSCKEELNYLRNALKHQGAPHETMGNMDIGGIQNINFQHNQDAHSYFLMLGSQPTKEAIKDYIDLFIMKARESPDQQFNLFAFTGKYVQGNECFYKELCNTIQQKADWPQNLRVVPLSFQNADHIVSLELNCHSITRSGGATIMELLVLNDACQNEKFADLPQRQRLIHAQKIEGRSLVESIPLWERGNFLHLQQELGDNLCRVVSPQENLF